MQTQNKFRYFVFFIYLSYLFFSCKTHKKITDKPKIKAEYKSAKTLLQYLRKNEFNYEWLTAKFSVDLKVNDNPISFDVNMRAKKDSALWLSISPAIIIPMGEVARVLVTKDSVKFIDRFTSTYFKGDYSYIGQIFNTELDFEMLQSMLIGNSVEFYEEDEKLKAAVDGDKYLLSTIRKRKLKKVMEGNKSLKELVQSIWLQAESYKISRILINDFNTDRTFEANYSNFQPVDSALFPFELKFNIKAAKTIEVKANYSKVSTGKAQTFPFNIPESYKPIAIPEK